MASLINSIPSTSTYKATTSLLTPQKPLDEDLKSHPKKRDNIDNKIEFAALAGGIATTLVYLTALAKFIKKKDFKFIDIFKMDYDHRTNFAGLSVPFRIIGLATSALVGGTTAGIIADKKENIKPKLKESVHQFLGNIITPITIVGTLSSIIDKKQFKPMKAQLLTCLACIGGVCGGVVGGNYIATAVNNKLFKEHDERKLHLKDFGIHVDDLLSMAAMSKAFSWIHPIIGYALPAIFQFCGYEAGVKNTENKD